MTSSCVTLLLLIASLNDVTAFAPPPKRPSATSLHAKKRKKTTKSNGGGGFGSKPTAVASPPKPVSADKNALEGQWDSFASITDLEIVPPGSPKDADYEHFIVADVFVRVGPSDDVDGDEESGNIGKSSATGWYRTGKAVAAGDDADIHAALTLQKGLIFWTAVHMWPQLAARGKAAARRLQLGYMPPSMSMADETDAALDEKEAEEVQIWHRADVLGVSVGDIGFRPDFNPRGFTYKRREGAATRRRKSSMAEVVEAS
eukprot:CAMPEP_0172538982 /NCGR_PEP_ID=MMETSP1067-20121228/10274_1 /TAXON_ID=265564 ORGANISM="Thalassiosira punctigera, Strain Tpunct2005C2" /NCGR_SAMPLE_ID=MMETSP1067 /ASSEMBLY_ACC=CAM_ASM_000444 /LENGTH=258 /DNA_ID=CAMNT_0013324593 /DNA_START=58 /DNA_END=834 /DNA_ORIENTATION=-